MRQGYLEVRRRDGVALGERAHTVRVMVKALGGEPVTHYLELVARDRPEFRPALV